MADQPPAPGHDIRDEPRGPEQLVTFWGAVVDQVVPVTTTTGNVPVVFGALSYAGVLTLTVVADPDACPEVDAIAAELRTGLDALCAETGVSRG
jgi:diacylglycerol O-acyltransferase / wax synthase